MRYCRGILAVFVLLGLAAGVYIGSGFYNVGADSPHWRLTSEVLKKARASSVERYAEKTVVAIDLNDPRVVLKGAGQYAAMCTSCHLAPDVKNTELRTGLYPQPPDLTKVRLDPREAFWVIKHGIKMTAMPAWGATHDDETIWSMVAFLQQLPDMTDAQYRDMLAKAPPDEDMEHVHESDHASSENH